MLFRSDVKKKIYQQSRRGESVDSLARRFCRTRTTIYRVLNEMRARRILELPLDYMYHESFDKANAEKEILSPMPVPATPTKKVRGPSGLPPYLAALYEVPLLTREQEYHLFRRFNYLKHKATKLRQKLDPVEIAACFQHRFFLRTLKDNYLFRFMRGKLNRFINQRFIMHDTTGLDAARGRENEFRMRVIKTR